MRKTAQVHSAAYHNLTLPEEHIAELIERVKGEETETTQDNLNQLCDLLKYAGVSASLLACCSPFS